MCVVLDTNAFGAFFDPSNKEHEDYKPVLQWVSFGKGKLVYGGRTYKDEMKKAVKYIRFFASLNRSGKTILLDDDSVNHWQERVREIEPSDKFDDPHLIAIILESKCKLICTNDKRAMPYIKENKFYINEAKRPRIYSSKRNADLLQDKYIAKICK